MIPCPECGMPLSNLGRISYPGPGPGMILFFKCISCHWAFAADSTQPHPRVEQFVRMDDGVAA